MHARLLTVSRCLLLLVVLDTRATAQVLLSRTGQGVLVQGPRAAVAPGQITADAFALESIDVGPPVKGAPFSAEAATEIVQTLADGNRIVRRTTGSLHRDSRGRTRREVNLQAIGGIILPGAPLQMVTISDPESGLTYVVDSDKQLRVLRGARDRPSTPRTAVAPANPSSGASPLQQAATTEQKESLGTREINGLVCEGTRTTVTIPAGAIGNERAIESVTERWVSPALRIVILSRRSDPRFGETTYQLTNVRRVEPPEALFATPR